MVVFKQRSEEQVAGARTPRKEAKKHRDFTLFFLALPGVVFFLIFSYIPMFGIVVAFKDFDVTKGVLGSDWNGLQNFVFFFQSSILGRILFNTLFLNVLFILATTFTSVLLAILINEIRLQFLRRFFQSTIFIPYFMSWVVISMILQGFLGGIGGQEPLVNTWLNFIGIPSINWYLQPSAWPVLLTFLKVWQGAGYLSIIYLAAITSISPEIYEAARIDGCTSAQMAWRITVPLLIPTILIMLLLSVGKIFYGDFGMIYSLVGDNGTLFPTTDVIDTYVFRALRASGNLGMTAAVGLFQSVVGLILVLIVNWTSRRYSDNTSLF